ncbi:hypothetical protein Tco_1153092 [Tanacetum coccineum]
MLVQGLILQGEGSTVQVETHHTPSCALTTSQPPLSSPLRIPTRQETEDRAAVTSLSPLPCPMIHLSQEVTHMEVKRAVSSQEDQYEDQLGVFSAAKVLADAAMKNVNTYTRRKRAVSTGSKGVSTTSRIFSTTEESISTVGASMPVSTAGMIQQVNIIIPSSSETTKTTKNKELAQKLHEEEQARFNAEQEAKLNAEQEELLASETTKVEANPSDADIDWDDVQAQIQTDKDLDQKLLEEESENLSIEERTRLLAELIDKRKKLQAAQ